jgi:putative ABC transport system permease protein
MSRLRSILSRVRGLLRARQLDREMQEEIAAHLEEATEELVRQGLSAEEARRAARRGFGGVVRAQEACRDARSFLWLDHLRRDARQAIRGLRRSPGFTLVVLVVLAIGTAAVTSVFTLLNAIVLRPLPFPDSDRLVVIQHAAPGLDLERTGLSSGLYFHYRQRARSLESIGVYQDERVLNLRVPGAAAERVHVTFASAALLRVLGVTPALGRLFTDDDGRPGFMSMKWRIPILLAHGFWVDHFGGDQNIVGRILTINDNAREVIGVLPEGFAFPGPDTQIWMLVEPPNVTASFARDFGWNAVARMRPGATAASARAELARILPRIEGAYRDATPQRLAEVSCARSIATARLRCGTRSARTPARSSACSSSRRWR